MALASALVAIALALFVARPAPTPGPLLRDFESYYAAGATWRFEGDPYSRAIWRVEKSVPGVDPTREELLPFVGPPFGLPLWSWFAQTSYERASAVWIASLAAALAVLVLGSLRLAGSFSARDALAALAFAAGFGPLTSGLALGQVAVIACAATVATLLLLRSGAILAAGGTALAAALQPNLAIVLAGRCGEWRATIALGGAALVAFGGSALALGGWPKLAAYAAALREHAQAERFIAIQTTPEAVARAFGLTPAVAGFFGLALAVAIVALLAAQYTARRYDPVARVALASSALPLALPFAHEHDFTVALFPALLCARRTTGPAWLAIALATLAVGVDWLGLAQRPSGLVATALLTVAAALALVTLAPGPLRPLHAIPLGVALVVIAVGSFVAAHPLPVWPDALPPGFRVDPSASTALVWGLEQRAAGLASVTPGLGALRLVPLLGCAVLWALASTTLATASRRSPALARSRRSSTVPDASQ